MTKAKVFASGNSQAVRLPKAFLFSSAEVEISPRERDQGTRNHRAAGNPHSGRHSRPRGRRPLRRYPRTLDRRRRTHR